MRDRFHATNPRAQQLRSIHRRQAAASRPNSPTTTSSGSRCRRWPRCWAAPNRCTATDATKRLALPTEESARIALRTQQIIAAESGVANTVDPVAGSYAIEMLTDEIERGAEAILERIERAGGTLAAIETGLIQREIQESAYRAQKAIDSGETVVVGMNTFAVANGGAAIDTLRIDPDVEAPSDRARPAPFAPSGTVRSVPRHWGAVSRAAHDGTNLVPHVITAVEASATVARSRTRCARCLANTKRPLRSNG